MNQELTSYTLRATQLVYIQLQQFTKQLTRRSYKKAKFEAIITVEYPIIKCLTARSENVWVRACIKSDNNNNIHALKNNISTSS